MAIGYKLRGVPKTFPNKAAAIIFLKNSPGYVQRQGDYLRTYWPGLMAELRGTTVANEKNAATAYAAPRTIFVPPAFTGGDSGVAGKPAGRTSAPSLEADYRKALNRREVSLGLPAKGRVAPNVADIVPPTKAEAKRIAQAKLDSVTSDFGDVRRQAGVVPKVAYGAVKAAGRVLGDDILETLGAAQSGRTYPTIPLPPSVQRATNVTEPLSRRTVDVTSAVADATLGKGIPNALQGQLPKNAMDVLGIGISAAAILPLGRGLRLAKAMAKTEAIAKGAASADDLERAAAAIVAADARLAKIEARLPSVGSREAKRLTVERETLLAGKTQLETFVKDAKVPNVLNETVQEAFAGVDEAIVAKNALNSQERAIRAKGAMKAYHDAGGGSAGMAAAKGELRGAYPQVDWNGVSQELTPELVDEMIRSLDADPNFPFYERLHIWEGLERATSGKNVQKHQLDAIRRQFGDSTADAFVKNKTFFAKLYNAGVHIWNIPRALMASFDLSAPFRQGLVAGTRHPVIFARNFKPMVKSAGSERVTRAIAEEIPTRANFQRYGIAKLKFTDMAGMREEQWPGSYVDNLVGVKQSARAYSSFLNKMRADVFDHMIDVAAAHGKNTDDPKFLEALGEIVMNSAGRGRIPGGDAGEAAATFLNQFLFSPRLLASRFQILNPVYYGRLAKTDPYLARQAAYQLATTLGGIGAMVYLASNIPGAKAGTDYLSADFGKVRIGDTRFDFAAGFQPLIVLYARLAKQEYVSSSTGQKTELGSGYGIPVSGDLIMRFMGSKAAPSPRIAWDIINRQNRIGEPVTPRSIATGMFPLNVQGGWDAYRQEGAPLGAAALLGSSIGFGTNSYPDTPAKTTSKTGSSGNRFSRTPSSSGNRFR